VVGGVTIVQLREKQASTRDFLTVAKAAKVVTDKHSIPLFINDRLDIALAVGCHLHVGQDDFPAGEARKLLGPDVLIGVSVNTAAELEEVLSLGSDIVDYVGLGPVHATQSKKDHNPPIGNRGTRDLLAMLGDSTIRAVAIGGVNVDTLPDLMAQSRVRLDSVTENDTKPAYRSLDGIAVVSAISAAKDVRTAARELARLFHAASKSIPERPKGLASADNFIDAACRLLQSLRDTEPRVCQNITNQVVMNDTANLTLAFSSSPIMSSSAEEAVDLSKILGALVLNMGTLTPAQVAGATVAGQAANRNGKPIVFDPVGVGASGFRKKTMAQLMDDVHMTVLKGNAGEIGAIAGLTEVQSRGVDSSGPGFKDPATVVQDLARREKMIVAMSGEIDYISDGDRVFSIKNGHPLQGDITGSGCMCTSAIACFLSVTGRQQAFEATIAAMLAYNIAAEIAGAEAEVHGPASFRTALIDACYRIDAETIRKRARLEIV